MTRSWNAGRVYGPRHIERKYSVLEVGTMADEDIPNLFSQLVFAM